MKYKQNLHTHSTFCDGNNSLEEMVVKAIELGFDSIGFSSHSDMKHSPIRHTYLHDKAGYFQEIDRLKEKYKNSLKIFCGIEYDMFSDFDTSEFDYAIGSVHYLLTNNEYVGFDRDDKEVERVINEYFGGNGMAYAKAYYEHLAELPSHGKFDIIGHLDLIAKHSEKRNFFDENSKEYMNYAVSAIEALQGKIPFFEVNTGAIARGYRTTPYPSVAILKELKRRGFGAIISSDCHNADMLDCGFDDAKKLLMECGFNETYILTEEGFKGIAI